VYMERQSVRYCSRLSTNVIMRDRTQISSVLKRYRLTSYIAYTLQGLEG